MPILQIGSIASSGMISDIDSYNTGPSVFNYLGNVRNQDGHIARGPVFLGYHSLTKDPRAIYASTDTNDINHIFNVQADGTIQEIFTNNPWTASDVSPTGFTPTSDSDAIVTIAETQNIVYINREDHEPVYRLKSGAGSFANLSSYNSGAHDSNGYPLAQFDATNRFKVLRTFDSFVVGLNVRKGGFLYPNMVKWSNVSDYSTPPRDWDFANGASSAGENTLAEMKSPILDACRIANDMLIFSREECWKMEYTGDANVFSFRRLHDAGVINTNCTTEHAGLCYVFGNNDIYISDGVTRKSISDHRVRKFVYSSLVPTETNKFFVAHDIANSTIHFCYVSTDAFCKFPYDPAQPASCNRAASYNWITDSWSMTDLPYVRAGYPVTFTTGLTIGDLSTIPFSAITGTFLSMASSVKNVMMFGSKTYTSPTLGTSISANLRLFSLFGNVSATVDTEATAPCLMVKSKITFDDTTGTGTGIKLRDTKQITSIYPQVQFDASSGPLTFYVGTMANSNDVPTYGLPIICDGSSYRLDVNAAARYFSMKIQYSDPHDFDFSSFDIEINSLGGI